MQSPLGNRQSAAYAREGIELDVSTLADWVGKAAAMLPLIEAIRAYVFAAKPIHADDTTVLDAAARRPRDRDELAQRLRDGRF